MPRKVVIVASERTAVCAGHAQRQIAFAFSLTPNPDGGPRITEDDIYRVTEDADNDWRIVEQIA